MLRNGNKWYSAFPLNHGQAQEIPNNSGVLAVTANENLFGGHAAILLESVDQHGDARVRLIDLTAEIGGSQELERIGSGSAGSYTSNSGTNEVTITIRDIPVNEKYFAVIERLDFQSFVVKNAEIDSVIREAEAFQRAVKDGKYVFRKYGGKLAKSTSSRGKVGVNCADFCIIVLRQAKIANLDDRLVNTPIRVAGGRRRQRKTPE